MQKLLKKGKRRVTLFVDEAHDLKGHATGINEGLFAVNSGLRERIVTVISGPKSAECSSDRFKCKATTHNLLSYETIIEGWGPHSCERKME
jgi:hypothetical protein